MQVMALYVKLEEALGDRRKIMYTDVKIRELYSESCELVSAAATALPTSDR